MLPAGFEEDQEVLALVEDDAPVADALAYFGRCVRVATEQLAATTDLSAPVPVPAAPWFPAELGSWEARWALSMASHEIARHTGHADIIRESIDGKESYELNDLADGARP